MRRREFVRLLGAAAGTWPVIARAQQSQHVRKVGVLMGSESNDAQMQARVAALTQGLQALGWKTGTDLQVEVAWYGGSLARATNEATDFVNRHMDLLVANGTIGIEAARAVTRSVPTVFAMVGDPVGSGFVQTLAHPGGNATGFSAFEPEIAGKWIQALKEIAPAIRQIGVLFYPGYEFLWRGAEAAAPTLAIKLIQATCKNAGDIEHSIVSIAEQPDSGLMVLPTPFFAAQRNLIVQLAAKHRLPAIYPFRYFAKAGGLLSYGIDAVDVYRRTASYVDRILKGLNAADLPVQAPTKYQLVINLKTAKVLGLAIPAAFIARADEVIE